MFNVIDYVFWILGGIFTLFWIVLFFKGKKSAGLFAGLDEKQYPFKDLYFIGYEFLEMIGYDYKTKNDRIMRKQMAVLNDCRYADYYIRVTRSQQVTIGLTLFVVSFSMYGLLDNIAGPLVFWMFAFAGFYYYGNLASETIKKRSEEMLTDFSNVVSKLALLTNAGLIMKDAWEQVAYNGDTVIYKEMQTSVEEMKNGYSEMDAIYRFGSRCMIPEIKKFTSTIVQGIQKGNSELTTMLQQQSAEVWNLKRQLVKRQGEKASGKLLIPMMMMFLGILIMVIVPVFTNIGKRPDLLVFYIHN